MYYGGCMSLVCFGVRVSRVVNITRHRHPLISTGRECSENQSDIKRTPMIL